ncbi:hypothetical protein [Endozoicomonas atrinae]|uniref:hypothetical protein n=1 Tax=Endozoicomonas atrinae TaxID=1333660 RepID=UPI003AFFB9FD
MPFPFDIPDNEKSELISKILKYTTRTQEENAQLKERVNILEQEIHRLKGLNGKPDIKPNTPKNDDSSSKPGDDNDAGAGHQKRDTGKPDERTKKKRKKPPKPSNPIRKRVAPVNIPEGSEYKGLNLYGVQEITFTVSLIQYLSFTTPIDIFLKPVVKGLIRYSGILFCHLFNTSSKA